MENKFYPLIFRMDPVRSLLAIFLVCFAGLLPARAQDSTTCTAQFYVSYDGNQVYFRAADSITGVQHDWNFGDSISSGWGNYVGITHTYSHPGSFVVTHKVSNPATGCHDSSVQVITIGAPPPPPACSIVFYYSHDSTKRNSPYWFYATPYVAGAANDTVTWFVNRTRVGTGDTLEKVFAPGAAYIVCAHLSTSLGCQTQSCQLIGVPDSLGNMAPPDSVNPGGPNVPPPGDSLGTTPPDSTGPTPPDSTLPPPPDSLAGFLPSYPNPATNKAYVDVHLDNPTMIYIRVYNGMGNQVEQQQVSGYTGNNRVPVSLTGLQSGIYLIQLQYGNTIKRSRIQKL